MKLVQTLFCFTLVTCPFSLLIQPVKVCADCTHFIGNTKKCRLFNEIDIVTGKPNYEDALDVRKDNKKCGENAIHFEKNYLSFITNPRYFIIEHWDYILVFSLYSIYGVLLAIQWTKN
jgi:hypothetical protein